MLTREQIINFTEILAVSSITAIGFVIGGTLGESVMSAIGIGLASNIVQSGTVKLKEKWIKGRNGILNHDIQLAFVRAYIKALDRLKNTYLDLYKTTDLHEYERESPEAIKSFFADLADEATNLTPSIKRIIEQAELKNYLYSTSNTSLDLLWERINVSSLLLTFNEHFRNFLRENLLQEIQLCFAEELKTDNKECNKAWRAFQRMLLEGIQADVKIVQATQDIIQQDLKLLKKVQEQLNQLQNHLESRTDNEPFQTQIQNVVIQLHTKLTEFIQRTEVKIDSLGESANRTEEKIDNIASDVKSLLEPETKLDKPKLPEQIQKFLNEGHDLRGAGEYEGARGKYRDALKIAIKMKHNLAKAIAQYMLSAILFEWDRKHNSAKELLLKCLKEFRKEKSDNYIVGSLSFLGTINIVVGNLDEAESYLSNSLELAEKIDNKELIAQILHQFGWLHDHRGKLKVALEFYSKALNLYLSIYNENDREPEESAIFGIGMCYYLSGLAHKRSGAVEETKANLIKALDWFRKCKNRPKEGLLLYLLSETNFLEALYEEGCEYLEAALKVYDDIKDYYWLSKCLILKARYFYTIGIQTKALEVIRLAIEKAELSQDYKQQVECNNILGNFHLDRKEFEESEKYFKRSGDLSLQNENLEMYASSVLDLAEIANTRKDVEKRDALLMDGLVCLEKFLLTVQSNHSRAYILKKIGFFYERLSKFDLALQYYYRANKIFNDLSDIYGIASSLGEIANLKGFLKKSNEEFDIYREIKKLVDGTSYYRIIAGVTIRLGEINLEMGNVDEAKILFEEALLISKKYNLSFLEHIEILIERLSKMLSLHKPPELNFKQLVEELFELVDWFPEADDSLLRLWLWGRRVELLSNYRNNMEAKFMVCQDDLNSFNKFVEIFSPYSDLCLQVVSSKYPGCGIDIVPFPLDKNIFFDYSAPVVMYV